ncbi:TetR/AcrR family transcriptional regulator [Corynebacterium minutissimum]|uniref:Transcriptional regulator n=1 Tax=Corynebacterium minutissimum TaxID=38301 RepID=A0A376D4B8_9CORY|nr:TetR family transcriptional regulator [Corynebacterium minutissimum]STC81835.1 transcriptional regulator [Corynebacterium minutissimum]
MDCVNKEKSIARGAARGRPGYSREDVIRAAVRVFTARGYDATSMDNVASELGISKSALYHHISSKEEILELTVVQALSRLEAVAEEMAEADVSAGAKVRGLLRGSIEVLCSDPKSVALLLRLRGNSEVERSALERRRILTRSVIPLVAAAQEEGAIRSDVDASLLTRMIFGMINSTSDWYEPEGRLDADELAATFESVVFGGLAPHAVKMK